jgi:hypothetical protein
MTKSNDRNMKTANLEYIERVDEIIEVDYMKFELLVLYCKWVQANMNGACTTMKCDVCGFMLIKFGQKIP